MQAIREIEGRVIYADKSIVYLVRKDKLFSSVDSGQTWRKIAGIPGSFGRKIAGFFSWTGRLLRLGAHHFLVDESTGVLFFNRSTLLVNCKDNIISPSAPISGSRPLAICALDNKFYYGEYFSNNEGGPVNILRYEKNRNEWRAVWTFNNVRHVHGVFSDPYTNSIWVTTGDKDHESWLWNTSDHFSTLRKVVGGTQQLRVVSLLFSKNYIYFGSDTPLEKNYIYRMERDTYLVERVAAVGGSVFFGSKVGSTLYFSTAVEPSLINQSRYAEVWQSHDGITWENCKKYKKDILPMKYFQYGQVLFPSGPGDECHLYITPFATEGHGCTYQFQI